MKARLRSLLKGEIVGLFLRASVLSALARLAQVAMAVVLARGLAPENYGMFIFATGVALLGGRIGSLGWPVMVLRLIPQYHEDKAWGDLRGLMRASAMVVLAGGVVTGLLIWMLALWLGPDHHLFVQLRLAAILVPVMAFQTLGRNELAGLHRMPMAIVTNELMPPALVVLFYYVTTLDTPLGAGLAYLAATTISALTAVAIVRRNTPAAVWTAPPRMQIGPWMKIALPALVGTSSLLLMNRTDVLMLAPLSDAQQVGFYGTAQRLTYLQTSPVILMSALLGPRMSQARARGQWDRLRRLFRGGLLFALVASLPMGALLLAFAVPILTWLFTAAYAPAAPALMILTLSQVAATLTIPATSLLLMSGRQNRFGATMAVALALNIAGNALLIPIYGAVGAAIATATVATVLMIAQIVSALAVLRADTPKASPDR